MAIIRFAHSRQPEPIDLVIDALAVARLARLVTADTLPPVQRARDALHRAFPQEGEVLHEEWQFDVEAGESGVARRPWRFGPFHGFAEVPAREALPYPIVMESHPIGELIQCRWCAGWWIACGSVAAMTIAPKLWRPFSRMLAFSEAAGLLGVFEER